MPAPPPSGSARLAASVAGLAHDDLPPDVILVARQCTLDTLGVTIAGAGQPAAEVLRGALGIAGADGSGGQGLATVLGTTARAEPVSAALANGTAGHALDYDDVSGPITAHPSVVVLPAVLALAERRGASGAEVVTAFVAGYEAMVRVGRALGTEHYARGFHTTGTAGALGAAAGCARLLGLDAAATETALGIAATQAAGLKAVFGTDCKPLHAGRAASNGVLAALLASGGFTAPPNVLGAAQGLAATHSAHFDEDALAEPFGQPWYTTETLFKLHAACYLTHASIECALQLRQQTDWRLADFRAAELRVPPGHLRVCGIEAPRTGLEGKFSLRYATALALATGRTDESQFTDARVEDPVIEAVRRGVTVQTDPTLETYASSLAVLISDGRRLEAVADTGRPAWLQPVPVAGWGDSPGGTSGRDAAAGDAPPAGPAAQEPALTRKFLGLVEPALGAAQAAELTAEIGRLDRLPSIRPLMRLAVPASGT